MEDSEQDCGEKWNCLWAQLNRDKACPLHDPASNKNVGEFRKALSDVIGIWMRGESPFLLQGTVFPASLGKDLRGLLGNGQRGLVLLGATFLGQIKFEGVIFKRDIDLDGATFKEAADFQGAEFNAKVSCVGATFERDALFHDAIFEQAVYFDRMICQNIDFSLAQFRSVVSFRGTPESILFQQAVEVNFDETRFFEPDLVRLAYVDFKNCSLLKTDLRGIDFSGVRWGEGGKWFIHIGKEKGTGYLFLHRGICFAYLTDPCLGFHAA